MVNECDKRDKRLKGKKVVVEGEDSLIIYVILKSEQKIINGEEIHKQNGDAC